MKTKAKPYDEPGTTRTEQPSPSRTRALLAAPLLRFVPFALAVLLVAYQLAAHSNLAQGLSAFLTSIVSIDITSVPPTSSDTIPLDIQDFVEAAIARALRDPVGRRDFALHAHGGRIMEELTSPSAQASDLPDFWHTNHPPEVALNEDVSIGMCWTLPGQSGQLGVVVVHLIYPTAFSLDHIPSEIAADIGKAPRVVVIWGVVDGQTNEQAMQQLLQTQRLPNPTPHGRPFPPISDQSRFVLLSSFEYDIHAMSRTQTFPVHPTITALRMCFGIFVVEIADNWGASSTCLYRVRIHGEEAPLHSL